MESVIRRKVGDDEVIIAGITDVQSYVTARTQAEQFAKANGLHVATMPALIDAFADPEIRGAVRLRFADTTSIEMQGKRRNAHVYEVSHGASRLSNLEGLKEGWQNMGACGFMPVTDWAEIEKAQNYVHISDIKNGEVPEEKHTVFVRVNKDKPNFQEGQLTYDEWMVNDIVLVRCGSEERRTNLAKVLYKGENRSEIGNYHRIAEVGFGENRGCPVFLYGSGGGLLGFDYIGDFGRFLVVGDGVAPVSTEGASLETITAPTIIAPTLEETLAIIGNPDYNKADMVREITARYQ